jgi:hypothetical protein
MADLPGNASGLLFRVYKGKKADRLVTRIDLGVVSLVVELRGHGRRAAEDLGQWKTGVEKRTVIDVSPAAITLALLLTDEELDWLEKGGARDGEIAMGGRPGGSGVTSPQPAAQSLGACPRTPSQCRGRRRATADGWRDGVESDPLAAAHEKRNVDAGTARNGTTVKVEVGIPTHENLFLSPAFRPVGRGPARHASIGKRCATTRGQSHPKLSRRRCGCPGAHSKRAISLDIPALRTSHPALEA